MDMALMCDMRIADATATFCEKYIDVGLLPGDGGAWLLPQVVGRSRALHLLWTAEAVHADQVMDWDSSTSWFPTVGYLTRWRS
jgi:enoyl-CoA hydratase/carnithine racemase